MKQIETLTPNEISKILRIHPFTVTRLAREGKIPAFKVGGIWRFRKDEFEQWVGSRSNRKHK
jgi:excisionase family DNA binding protein